MSKWWDGATLRQYIKLNRIPRVLRSQIFPTYDELDEDLLLAWEKKLTSNKLMGILIENADIKEARLQTEIDTLEQEVKNLNLRGHIEELQDFK